MCVCVSIGNVFLFPTLHRFAFNMNIWQITTQAKSTHTPTHVEIAISCFVYLKLNKRFVWQLEKLAQIRAGYGMQRQQIKTLTFGAKTEIALHSTSRQRWNEFSMQWNSMRDSIVVLVFPFELLLCALNLEVVCCFAFKSQSWLQSPANRISHLIKLKIRSRVFIK